MGNQVERRLRKKEPSESQSGSSFSVQLGGKKKPKTRAVVIEGRD